MVDTDALDEHEGAGTIIYVDPEKEAAVLRKFDKYLLPVSVVFLVLSTLDRNNLGNAVVFGLDTDLGLVGGEFGNINTLSSVCTILFEVPWVLAVRRFGANKALGASLATWSLCTLGTAFIQNYAQAIVVRMLLNACEAGLAQGFAYLFSTIYPREVAGKRIMTTNLSACISGAFGGLFAYAIQLMGNRNGLAAWRWLFIVEFCITVVIGGIAFIFLPSSAETAWFLNAEEKETMRLKRERDMIHRGDEKFDRKWIKIALTDPFVYLLGIAFFTSSVAINGFGVFLPTIIAGLGYASLRVNYMTIPVYVLGAISLVIQVYMSDKLRKRGAFIMGCCVPVAVGYLICVGTENAHAGYAGMFVLVLGLFPISTLAVTWIATNLSPDAKRAIGMPLAYSIANVSALVSSQLYPSQQGPRYVMGNAISAGLTVVAAFLYGACWLLLRRRNSKKAKLIAEGATTNGLEGDMSLDSMYIL
ncbi:high-affinity nicotinic acid transporter-like protein [Talaromyces proteolyticus]|uniref:High-affinity nicotinic acid transporter-like protein n=1 Tax=Talaromyces proteolyticus TaxID=1131652 RepID=A0AAD4KQD5_9EURO|nr:high-affinity nicotinic acid transporter-like protein [Talaromyces proteolyticus]KAH8694248.1 high-affinity nicotinic acid transporter-like protein [Talaromyces proteolyticus]